jgi:hypothetical protein
MIAWLTHQAAWSATLVTGLGLAALVVVALSRRLRLAIGSTLPLSTLIASLTLTIALLLRPPVPRERVEPEIAPQHALSAADLKAAFGAGPVPSPAEAPPLKSPQNAVADKAPVLVSASWLTMANVARTVAAATRFVNEHSAWIAGLMAAGVMLGTVRLVAGLMEVGRLRRRATMIADRDLEELADVLRAELGCVRRV